MEAATTLESPLNWSICVHDCDFVPLFIKNVALFVVMFGTILKKTQ